MQRIKVRHNQSLMDIAIEQYGNVEGVFRLVKDNPKLLGITDNVYSGDELLIDTQSDVIKSRTKEYLGQYKIATLRQADRASGIGYWVINENFVVQ